MTPGRWEPRIRPRARPVGRPRSLCPGGGNVGVDSDVRRCGFRRKQRPLRSERSPRRTNFLRGAALPRPLRCPCGCWGKPRVRPGQPLADPAAPRLREVELVPPEKNGFLEFARSTAGPSRLRRVRCPCRWSVPCALTGGRAQMGLTLPHFLFSNSSRCCRTRADMGTVAVGSGIFGHLERRAWANAGARRSSPPGFAACASKRPPGFEPFGPCLDLKSKKGRVSR